MNVIPGGMGTRTTAGTALVALGLATTSIGFLTMGPANAVPSEDPGGNNSTIKVEDVEVDSKDSETAENNPHLPCTFTVEWYNFDAGDYYSDITFELQEPTGDKDHTFEVVGPSHVFIGEDAADGVGNGPDNGLDARKTYTMSFTGEPAAQGFHVKITTDSDGSKGADKKHKTFWVGPCETQTPSDLPSESASSPTESESSPTDEESSPYEVETSPTESESSPTDEESSPYEVETSPTESESSPAEEESSPAEVESSTTPTVLPTESSPAEEESSPTESESSSTPTVLPTSSTAPPEDEESTTPTVLPTQASSPAEAPTAVDAGLAGSGDDQGPPSSLLILFGAALAVVGLGVGFVPVLTRGKHSH